MLNYYQQIAILTDKLKSEGKLVKYTVLPSTIHNNRKSTWIKR